MPIVKAENQNYSGKRKYIIISGLPGVGKTQLACSASDKVLVIDTDNGLCRVNHEFRKDASICQNYKEILADVNEAQGQYDTIVIDTGGALIDYLKDWAMETDPKATKKDGGFSLQGFGIVKQEFLRLSAWLRQRFNVILIFHESIEKDNEDVRYQLVAEGSCRVLCYQPADLAGHMFIQGGKRYIGFTPTEQYTAKSAYGIKGVYEIPELNHGDKNNFLARLFAKVDENLAKEAEADEEETTAYRKVIDAGLDIILNVKAVEDVPKAMAEFKKLKHVSTSKQELENEFKKRLEELNITYDKQAKKYVYAES